MRFAIKSKIQLTFTQLLFKIESVDYFNILKSLQSVKTGEPILSAAEATVTPFNSCQLPKPQDLGLSERQTALTALCS